MGPNGCEDIDECVNNGCHSDANCINTPGSFQCSCKTGFRGNGMLCFDINECQLSNPCRSQGSRCLNTAGSFRCVCRQGFKGMFSLSQKYNSILIRLESENNICADIDECKDTSSCSNTENSICINSPGGFQCICRKGHVMYKEGLTCVV